MSATRRYDRKTHEGAAGSEPERRLMLDWQAMTCLGRVMPGRHSRLLCFGIAHGRVRHNV